MRQWRRTACVLSALTLLVGVGIAAGRAQLAPTPAGRGPSSAAGPHRRERPVINERAVARTGVEHRTRARPGAPTWRSPAVGAAPRCVRRPRCRPASRRPYDAVVRAIGARGLRPSADLERDQLTQRRVPADGEDRHDHHPRSRRAPARRRRRARRPLAGAGGVATNPRSGAGTVHPARGSRRRSPRRTGTSSRTGSGCRSIRASCRRAPEPSASGRRA